MDIQTNLNEKEIEQLANSQTDHVIEAANAAWTDDDNDFPEDMLRPIVYEALKLMGMTILKRHFEEIIKVQELYFDHTRKVNDETINILKNLVKKNDN